MIFISIAKRGPIQQKSRLWHPFIHSYSGIHSLLNKTTNLVKQWTQNYFVELIQGVQKRQ